MPFWKVESVFLPCSNIPQLSSPLLTMEASLFTSIALSDEHCEDNSYAF